MICRLRLSLSGRRFHRVAHSDFVGIGFRLMHSHYSVVDIFAGPGGLAEGFASVTAADGGRPFKISLSVEKEPSAHATLLLRTFLRQFPSNPPEYYDFINGGTAEPDWAALYPDEWKKATEDALLAELGNRDSEALINTRIDAIRAGGTESILIGGPPCQAYSLVGRARNRGVEGYVPEEDARHFLYREYIRILQRLKPVAFVMENVKGMLSSSLDSERIFDRVLEDLKNATGRGSYGLVALAPGDEMANQDLFSHPHPENFIVQSEDFGLPQARHRIIIVGVRSDVLGGLGDWHRGRPLLRSRKNKVPVKSVLDGMPKLRSGLSRSEDTQDGWAEAADAALNRVLDADLGLGPANAKRMRERIRGLRSTVASGTTLKRAAARRPGIGSGCPADLRGWILDTRLAVLPNNETRAHMAADLARYAFAAVFAELIGRSPKAEDFPPSLAPDHRNWRSGDFADRFRVQLYDHPSTTITSHISKDGHYFIHPDPAQCRSLTVREAARLQTFPDNYYFKGNRTQQFVQVGNAVPPFLAKQIGDALLSLIGSAKVISKPPRKHRRDRNNRRLGRRARALLGT